MAKKTAKISVESQERVRWRGRVLYVENGSVRYGDQTIVMPHFNQCVGFLLDEGECYAVGDYGCCLQFFIEPECPDRLCCQVVQV